MSITAAPTHDTVPARIARTLAPGYGYCLRCGMPWSRVFWHSTSYSPRRACFPLCEGCWQLLGHPEARIEYYKTLIDEWESDGLLREDDRAAIGRAVANEVTP